MELAKKFKHLNLDFTQLGEEEEFNPRWPCGLTPVFSRLTPCLTRATHTRGAREAASGKQSGRTQEIQRLIGRSLRAVTDVAKLGERQVTIDCDVLQADGGTRTAAITGGYVALADAVGYLRGRHDHAPAPVTGRADAESELGLADLGHGRGDVLRRLARLHLAE